MSLSGRLQRCRVSGRAWHSNGTILRGKYKPELHVVLGFLRQALVWASYGDGMQSLSDLD